MKIAYLFAGQGAQKIGMGYDFYQTNPLSKESYDSIEIDFDLKEVCFKDALGVLNQTQYTQSCLLATSMAIAQAVESCGYHPVCVGGLSLGEYTALCFAGSLSINDAVKLVRARGLIMANALKENNTSMTALINIDLKTIQSVLDDSQVKACGLVEIANYNSPKQIVITGEIAALRIVEEKLRELSIGRIIPLKVSGAFHSSLLKEASMELNEVLKVQLFKDPKLPVYYNVTGQKEDFSIELLTRQIASSVHFETMINSMIKDGIDTFIEIGPGRTLSSFVKQINPDVKAISIESIEDLDTLKGAFPL